jgi:hypothetical protein
MSDVFAKMKGRLGARRSNYPVGSVAGQVISYDAQANTAVVRPLGFEEKLGDEIKVKLGRNEKNVNSPDIHEMATGTQDSRMKTPEGGILQLDGLIKRGDAYESSWISLLSKNPETNPVVANVQTRISEVRNAKGEVVHDKRNSRLFAVDIYHVDDAVKPESPESLKAAVIDCFENARIPTGRDNLGAAIGLLGDDGTLVLRTVHSVGYDKEAEAPRTSEAAWQALVERFGGEDQVQEVYDNGGAFEVFPTSRVLVGGKTAQEVENSLKAGKSPRKVAVDRCVMSETESGRTVYGAVPMNLTLKLHDDGQAFVTHARTSTMMRPVPLAALNTAYAENARKAWFEAEKKRREEQANPEGPSGDEGASNETASREAASNEGAAKERQDRKPEPAGAAAPNEPAGEEAGAVMDDNVTSLIDGFDDLEEGVGEGPEPEQL